MIEKTKIQNQIQDVFQCDTSNSFSLLYAYCTCKIISEESCFETDVKKAYYNVRKNCTNTERLAFLRIDPSRGLDKLEKLCNYFFEMTFVNFLSIFAPGFVCNGKDVFHLKSSLGLSWLNMGYLITTIKRVHDIVSNSSYSSVKDMYEAIMNTFYIICGNYLILPKDKIVPIYKAVCLIKLNDEGIGRLKEATQTVELCVANGISRENIPEFFLKAKDRNEFQKFAEDNKLSAKKLLLCRERVIKQHHKEVELLCAASYDPEANDVYLENCYLYPRFSDTFSGIENPTVAIFFPSDFLIRKFLFDSSFRNVNFVFVLSSKYKCQVYKKYYNRMNFRGSGSVLFCTFDKLSEDNKMNVDSVLLITTHIPEEKQKEILPVIVAICNDDTQVLSLHESSKFEKTCDHLAQFIRSEKVDVQQVDILPLGLILSEGKRKKILVKWGMANASSQKAIDGKDVFINKYNLICDDYQYLSKSSNALRVSKKDLFENGNSIRKVFRNLVYINRSGQKRTPAKEYRFSPEISVFYTIDDQKADGTVRLRCHLKKPSKTKKNGVVIEESERCFRRVLQININEVIEEEYLYGAKGGKLIRDIYKEHCFEIANAKTISLKSFFYLNFDWEKWQVEDADTLELSKAIVNNEIGELDIVTATAKEYEKAYYYSSLVNTKIEFEKYIEILEEITKSAVSCFVCSDNIWADFFPDTQYRKDKKFDMVQCAGKAMNTRFLTRTQINKVYHRALKEICSGKPEYSAVLIKLFTGMRDREVGELFWRDLCYCEEHDFYMLKPTLDKNRYLAGRSVPHEIPCVSLLSNVLTDIKAELSKKHSVEEIRMMPIIPNYKNKSNIYESCKPEAIRRLCKELLDFLNEGIVINADGGDLILKPYRGDLLRENFRRMLIKHTNLTDNEISIVMDTKPKKMFSRCYTNYQDEDVLNMLYIKLHSIENLID